MHSYAHGLVFSFTFAGTLRHAAGSDSRALLAAREPLQVRRERGRTREAALGDAPTLRALRRRQLGRRQCAVARRLSARGACAQCFAQCATSSAPSVAALPA